MRAFSAFALPSALVLSSALVPSAARAQGGVDAHLGRWAVSGPDATAYSLGVRRDFWGPLGYGIRGLALVPEDSAGRSLYGLGPEVTLLRGRREPGPYAVAGFGLAVEPGGSPRVVGLWSAGIGFEFRPASWLSVALEGRRLVEDRGFDGFWDLDDVDRRGWLIGAGVSVHWGGASGRSGGERRDPGPRIGSGDGAAGIGGGGPGDASGEAGGGDGGPDPDGGPGRTDREGLELAGRVVETALAAMGEPYRWGGTSTEEGFDCSGLVWYAYASHDVDLPRMSRDQARVGRGVPADPGRLEPGDILLFAGHGGDRVTHVGLYVGDRRFIHATTSGGVRVGELGGSADPNDRWWQERWIGARRVLN
jgi:hypothetical protein